MSPAENVKRKLYLQRRVSDLVVGQLVPGLLPVGEYLPEHDSEAPTSLSVVKRRYMMLSGGIQRIGSIVSVDEVLRGQVHHAGCNLLSDVQHLGLSELHHDAVLPVGHQHRVRAVRPGHRDKQTVEYADADGENMASGGSDP
ncbi:hypothetical protein F7725_015151 [Dissostichus mawsoni]|uniref:Uncharacterized protein n=1 Tax=Dissostichus mawsoni TaxID=36200 RepID=A0A7J5YGQ1_DISMA|nr:hypothetical protein F7725_015151 [Dissostichus mawsoni]